MYLTTFVMIGSIGQILTREKELLVKLKESSFCQIACRLWMEPISNWHLNHSVQVKQIIMATNMLIALLVMFGATRDAGSEITWQVLQDQCTIAVCGRIWMSTRTQRNTFPQVSLFSLIPHTNPPGSVFQPINASVAIICSYPIKNQNLISVLHTLELRVST